ncbi:MAG: DUF3365 domain-containing protein [Prosthecobacter sp.]|uniref:c-type heme family protein n=1 Tax=Prosthecobacter sp. TaxID=1965333 RepID=UPI003BB0E893
MIAPAIFRASLLAVLWGLVGLPLHAGVPEAVVLEDQGIQIIDDQLNPVLFHHERQVNALLGSEGFGRLRTMRFIHGAWMLPGDFGASWSDDDGKYEVPLVDMMVVLNAPEVHYLSSLESYNEKYDFWPSIQRMKTLAAFKQRDESFLQAGKLYVSRLSESERKKYGEQPLIAPRGLDEFETKAFRLLQAGHALVVKQEGEVFRALGAIRMQESCRRCHEDKKNGDLLGAFTYLGLRERDATAEEQKRRAQLRLDALGDINDAKFLATYLSLSKPIVDEESRAFLLDRALSKEGVITRPMVERMRATRAKLPERQERSEKPPTPPQESGSK